MSETRFTPEDLTLMADTLAFVMEEGSPEGPEMATAMLHQAAQDARVIEQLRAWLERQQGCYLNHDDCQCKAKLTSLDVLAELDRLAPPQRQE